MDEFLGKDVIGAGVVSGFGAELVGLVDGPVQLTEMAVGDQTEIVVIVEDDPPVARDAEVLQEHVAGEDVGRGQVTDRLAEVEHGVAWNWALKRWVNVWLLAAALRVSVSNPQPIADRRN
jgi:hypothetical protein